MSLLNSTPQHHWNLDEADNVDKVDSVSGNNAVDQGAHTYDSRAGKVGNAVEFDGTAGQYLASPFAASQRIDNSFWTIATWVYFDSLSPAAGIAGVYSNSGANRSWRLWMFAGGPGIQFRVYTNGSSEASAVALNNGVVLTTGKWYLVMAFHDPDADTINLWVQAEDAGSVTKASTALVGGAGGSAAVGQRIGHDGSVASLGGRVDHMTIWKGGASAAPTDSEFAFIFNNGAGRAYPYTFVESTAARIDGSLKAGGSSHIYAPPFINI